MHVDEERSMREDENIIPSLFPDREDERGHGEYIHTHMCVCVCVCVYIYII